MEKAIAVEGLYKVYHPKRADKVIAVDHITFDGHFGEILGILGPNGSGKTSTIKSIASIIDFEEGRIEVMGQDNRRRRKQIVQHIGAVLEGSRNVYWTMSPLENMIYFAGLKGMSKRDVQERVDKYIELLNLEEVAHKQVRSFSKGMQQKVAIACALIADPRIVLLDEPTLGLDVETSRKMQTFIKEIAKEQRHIMITSHDMRFIEKTCSRVIIMKKGKLIADDSVKNLNQFFRKQAFKLTVRNHLNTPLLKEMEACCEFRIESHEGFTELFLIFNDSQALYSVFDILRKYNIELLGVDVIKDDLEDIFLKLINGYLTNNGEERQ
ncbi:MAG TPA: ABC transporter ATP-binding protein [Firmicutes bacterium]|nr:ABC transporter ATP-binding protein [Bacillota bacterium]